MSNSNENLPSLSAAVARGNVSCAVIRLYLAVFDDLSPAEAKIILDHAQACPDCLLELQQFTRANRLIASLPALETPARLDRAVLTVIAARAEHRPLARSLPPDQLPRTPYPRRKRRTLSWTAGLAVAAVLVLAALFLFRSLTTPAQAFALPTNLSWSGYVLHYNLEQANASGTHFLMDCYQDLGNQELHAETSMPGQWDIVLVGDQQSMLGKDMMHQVAQENVDGWDLCSPQFNLASLRNAIQQKQAIYLGKSQFAGQAVYQIRTTNGLILLLDMQYRPVNALQPTPVVSGFSSQMEYKPLYTRVDLMSASQVGNDMWSRSVPPYFRRGTITAMP